MEKINIYVPENIGNKLDNDAALFEVFKKDGHTVNKNRFLSMLILGYYNRYVSESQGVYRDILNLLNSLDVDSIEKQKVADNILQNIILPSVPLRKGKNPTRLSLKPTRETENLILNIYDEIAGDDYISQYFCRMFMCYCDKPFSEREQIIFRENYEKLIDACEKHNAISFTTIWNTEKIHHVMPYRLAIGEEEMFNYLVCVEINEMTGRQETKSYRLNRITRINNSRKNFTIDNESLNHLDRMLEFGPQYMINSDEEICVKISQSGEKSFNRIYYGRPKVDRTEQTDLGKLMYFKGSWEQVYFYFRRFAAGEAEIISPIGLRERMIQFYQKSLETYMGGDNL